MTHHLRMFESCAGLIDLAQVTDDLGSQTGPLISLETFREFYKPHMQRFIDLCHGFGIKVFHHDDGAIRTFLPDLVEMGIDILNPVQWVCPGMELDGIESAISARRSASTAASRTSESSPSAPRRKCAPKCGTTSTPSPPTAPATSSPPATTSKPSPRWKTSLPCTMRRGITGVSRKGGLETQRHRDRETQRGKEKVSRKQYCDCLLHSYFPPL